MTVTLNEVALIRLLESREGAVGQKIESLTQEVENVLRQEVEAILVGAATYVDSFVVTSADGIEGIVGIDVTPSERIARWLGVKDAREQKPFRSALRRVFPD